MVPNIFDSPGFETSLAAFLWHLQYCVPGVTPSGQLASIFDFDDFSQQLIASQTSVGDEARSTGFVLPQWPTRFVVEQTLGHFAASRLPTIFPMVDIEAMTSLIEANPLGPSARNMNAGDRACLAAFTAFVTRIEHHELAFLCPTPDSYLQAALSLVPQLLVEHSNIRALEALLIMVGRPMVCELADVY